MELSLPRTYLVVEHKEPLWKQLPSGPPSGGRDTACQDFQRGAAENSMTEMIRFSLTPPPRLEFPYLDIILTSQVHHHTVSVYWWLRCGLELF